MLYSFKTVKSRYLFSGLIICIISLLLASVSNYIISLRITSEQTEANLRESALRNTAELDAWFSTFQNILDDTVEDLEISGRYAPDSLQHMLSAKLSRSTTGDIFDLYIGLEAPDQPLISAIGWIPDSTYNPHDRPWYIKARGTGSTIFTEPYIDAQTGRMVITIARKIVKDGQLYGVMAADVFITKVLDKVRRYSLSEHSYAFLLDENANFASHPGTAFHPGKDGVTNLQDLEDSDYSRLLKSLFQDQSQIRRGTDFNGRSAYFLLSRIPSNHWLFGISIPVSDYRKPLRLLLKGFVIAVIVSLLITAVIMLHLMDDLAHPIRALTGTIESFSRTNLDVRAEITSQDEIGELGRMFNHMADTIREYSLSMESKVAERTREVREKSIRIQKSIEYAKTLQEAILPDPSELKSVLRDHFVIWEPKDVVGGDFYWFRNYADGFVIIVGDCTGHGVPGALMTVAATSLLDRIITTEHHRDPSSILSELNRLLHQTLQKTEGQHIQDGLDAAILFVSRELDTAYFAGAGLSILLVDDGNPQEIRGNRQGIGFTSFKNGASFNRQELAIHPGMSFYMATDGIRDQIGETTRLPFGRTHLKRLLASGEHLDMKDQNEQILRAIKDHRGGETIRDDITLFAFRI